MDRADWPSHPLIGTIERASSRHVSVLQSVGVDTHAVRMTMGSAQAVPFMCRMDLL
jgi:hypothetical protein